MLVAGQYNLHFLIYLGSPTYFNLPPDQGIVEQTTVSSRIPETLNTSLEAAAASKGVFRSEIIRRALRYYIEQNPDEIDAFNGNQVAITTLGNCLGSPHSTRRPKSPSDTDMA